MGMHSIENRYSSPPPFGAFTPRDGLPGLEWLRRQHFIGPAHRAVLSPTQGHTKISTHRHDMALAAVFQAVEEIGIIPVIGITGDTHVPHGSVAKLIVTLCYLQLVVFFLPEHFNIW
jgi:hypothetical protein